MVPVVGAVVVQLGARTASEINKIRQIARSPFLMFTSF